MHSSTIRVFRIYIAENRPSVFDIIYGLFRSHGIARPTAATQNHRKSITKASRSRCCLRSARNGPWSGAFPQGACRIAGSRSKTRRREPVAWPPPSTLSRPGARIFLQKHRPFPHAADTERPVCHLAWTAYEALFRPLLSDYVGTSLVMGFSEDAELAADSLFPMWFMCSHREFTLWADHFFPGLRFGRMYLNHVWLRAPL